MTALAMKLFFFGLQTSNDIIAGNVREGFIIVFIWSQLDGGKVEQRTMA